MPRENVNDLLAFLAVARERSFTRAAAKSGVSQSALSHTIRQLETRLGIRLLTRTTRAVSTTEAGQRLLDGIGPHFDEIDAQLDALSELRDKPAGTIRISAADYAINHVLWPKLRKFLPNYPDIKVELMLDNGLTDIVMERYDAGVRMGEQLAKDMISARIGPDFCFAVVGSTSYFKNNPEPSHPQDLVRHTCINERMPTSGGIWAWEFEENGREIKIRVEGQLVFNNILQRHRCSPRRVRPCLHAGRNSPAAYRERTSEARPRGFFALLGRLPPLLSQQTAILARLHRFG